VPKKDGEGDTAENQVATSAWLEVGLAEYTALREEIIATMKTQDGGLRFGVAALGIVSAAGFNVWEDTAAAALIFLFVIPFVSVVVLTVWMGEVTRMMRAGKYILRLENEFHEQLDDLPTSFMRWESSLRDPNSEITRWERHYEWNYNAIVLLFWSIGIASIGAGLYRGLWGDDPFGNATAIAAAAGASTLLSVIALLLILRQLTAVCETEGRLRFLRGFDFGRDRLLHPLRGFRFGRDRSPAHKPAANSDGGRGEPNG
jgi:hypothetical protein